MALISVREYGKLYVGDFDPERPSICSAQADLLTNLSAIYGYEVFKFINGKTLAAQQYVGAFQFGPHTIEVLPKIDGTAPNVRRNLVAMLSVAHGLEISEGDVARVAVQDYGILEVLIKLFCDKLFTQVHKGLVRRYVGREDNLYVLRGRLGVVEQIRLNAANPERLFCRYDDFNEDNSLNQILKAAIRLLLVASRALSNQRQLAELLLAFEGVTDCRIGALPWHLISFDRLNDRYKPCFKMAELFLKQFPPDVTGGRVQGFSLFFEMYSLFEEYIGRMAVRAFRPQGYEIALQGPQSHLAIREGLRTPAFTMKPDVVAFRDSKIAWILDTKWKELSKEKAKDGVVQSDLYQMYAYASCYQCPEIVLLYPHHSELGLTAGTRDSYFLKPWIAEAGNSEYRRVQVATIDLSNLATVQVQLMQIILDSGVSRRFANANVAL